MQKFKVHFQKFYSSFPLENILNFFVVAVIVVIIILATLALHRPITSKQYTDVIQYSQQAAYPKTQLIALQLRQKDEICVLEYLRLLRAYSYENNHIKQYPALDMKDAQ